jgi:hypothetical protein
VGLFTLVANDEARRPPVHAYLQHPEWRKVWMHMIDRSAIPLEDEFQALAVMRPVEQEFYERVAVKLRESAQQNIMPDEIQQAHSSSPFPTPTSSQPGRTDTPSLPPIVSALRPFRWGMTKKEVKRLMDGHFALPPSPTEDALGWIIQLYGVSTSVIAYFRPTIMGGRLARLGLQLFVDGHPSDDALAGLFSLLKRELVSFYGEPGHTSHGGRAIPVEFRQTEIVSWVDGPSLLLMSVGLLRDGVPAKVSGLGLSYGDLQWDRMSQMRAELHRRK